jgi:glycogen(starch) synthase
VLFWSETFWPRAGGVERLAELLLPALCARGHEFAVVTWSDDMHGVASCFDGIPIHRFRFFRGSQREGAIAAIEDLDAVRALKRRFAPDVVHVNSCGRSAWFHLSTNSGGVPTVVTLHQPLGDEVGGESVAGRLLGTAARIACCSQAVLDSVRAFSTAMAAKAGVIGNALPAVRAAPTPASLEAPQLLFVGRLVAEKGLAQLVECLPPLFARFPHARLIVAGDGPLRGELEAQVAAAALGPFVRFVGAVAPESVGELIAAASVVVAPSRVEGFGLVALEAAMLGRPVVATRAGGLPEVVEHGRTGLLADVGDMRGFVDAIGRLLDDRDAAARMGAKAHERALARFDWPRHVRAYDELYRRVAS